MPDNAGSPSDKGENGAAPDSAAIQKLIDDAVGRALSARLPRVKNTEETIAKMVADAVAKLPHAEAAKPAGDPVGEPEKPTLKSLHDQIAKLTQGIQERDKKVTEAEQKAREVRLRSDIQSQFAKHLGADSPHLEPYVNHFSAQFIDQDGRTMRRIKNEYGEDQLVPAGQAVEELFKGELKHLVTSSKAPNLPRAQVLGSPFQAIQPPQNGNHPLNPILGEFARHFAQQGEVGLANAVLANQPNGEAKK